MTGDPLEDLKQYYLEQPWQYVAHFGWPDRFQLNQDLQDHLDRLNVGRNDNVSVADEVRRGLNAILERINSGGTWHFEELVAQSRRQRTCQPVIRTYDGA